MDIGLGVCLPSNTILKILVSLSVYNVLRKQHFEEKGQMLRPRLSRPLRRLISDYIQLETVSIFIHDLNDNYIPHITSIVREPAA
jgi:hypothetical protein